MRAVCVWILAMACTTTPPQKVVEPADHDEVVAPPSDAAVGAALIDAGATVEAGTTSEIPGLGSCTADADCVLSSYQEGCCVQACESYATNKADLAKRQATENCAISKRVCPPPSPCRRAEHTITGARCSAGRCVAVARPLPAAP